MVEGRKRARSRGEQRVSSRGETAGTAAQVESEVSDPHPHLSVLADVDAPTHRPAAGALPLPPGSPATDWVTDRVCTTGFPTTTTTSITMVVIPFTFPLFQKSAKSRAHQSAIHSSPDPKSSAATAVTT